MSIERTCPHHGRYNAREIASLPGESPVLSGCPDCAARARAVTEQARARSAQKLRSTHLKRLVEASNIPPRFAGVTISDYQVTTRQQAAVKAVCCAYLEEWPEQRTKGSSLVLTGRCGTGKTHLACAIANAVMAEHGSDVLFGTVTHLMRLLRASFNARSDRSERQAIEAMVGPDLLIIDEVGAQAGTAHEMGILFELVNERYAAMRPTILISNLNAEALEEYIGERTMDRMRHNGTILACDWESFRTAPASLHRVAGGAAR